MVNTVAVMIVRASPTVVTKAIGLIPRCGMEPISLRDIMEARVSMVPDRITACRSLIGGDATASVIAAIADRALIGVRWGEGLWRGDRCPIAAACPIVARCQDGSPDSVIARIRDIGDPVGRTAANSIAQDMARWSVAPWGIADRTLVDGHSAHRIQVSIGRTQSVMMQVDPMATATHFTAPSSSRKGQALASTRWDVPPVPAFTDPIGIAPPSIGCHLAMKIVVTTIPAVKKAADTSLPAAKHMVPVVRMGRHPGNIAKATDPIAIVPTMGRTVQKISAIPSKTLPRYLGGWLTRSRMAGLM